MEEEKQNPSAENQPRRSIQDIGLIRPAPKPAAPATTGLEDALTQVRKENSEASIKSIKTYQSDVAEAIKKDNVSVIKMALAEKRRQDKQGFTEANVTKESYKRLIYIGVSVFLILVGGGLLSYFYFAHKNAGVAVAVDVSRNIIYSEKSKEIQLDNRNPKTLIADLAAEKAKGRPNASIENFILTTNTNGTSTDQAARRLIGTQEFIGLFSTNIPALFYRSLQDPFMLGFYQNSAGVDTFLILKTDSYDNAFAGMLGWERWIDYDMGQVFSIPVLNSGDNTGVPKPFTDRVVENRDTRVLTDNNGKVVFLYSFIDSNTLVMTTSENSFREILARFIQIQRQK